MSTPTETFSGTDIDYVRVLLGQAGRYTFIPEKDEPQMAVAHNKMYVNFQDVTDVVGIWAQNDWNHSGTNLALSGSFDSRKGIFTATSGSFTAGNEYLITYFHGDGLVDREVQRCLDDADAQIKLFLYDGNVTYDTTTTKGKMTYALKINLAALHALAILNTGNVIQSGFNYALGEVRLETKLWGEGMSTEGLLMRFENKVNSLIEWLKLYWSDTALIQVLDRTKGESRYDRGRMKRLIRTGNLHDWIMDGITVSQSFRVIEPDYSWG